MDHQVDKWHVNCEHYVIVIIIIAKSVVVSELQFTLKKNIKLPSNVQ